MSRRANKIAAVLFSAYALSQAYIAVLLRTLGRDVLRLQTTAKPENLQRIIESWTPEQAAQYRKHLAPDTLHPLLYGAALIAAARAGHRPSTPRGMRVAAVIAPALAAGCDLAENALHARFIAQPGRITPRHARASTLFTRAKWVLAFGTAGVLLARAVHHRRSRS